MKGKLIILLPLIVLVAIVEAQHYAEEMQHYSNSFSLELIHRHAYQFNNDRKPKAQHERLKDLLHHDIIRHNITSHRLRTRRRAAEEAVSPAASVEMPLKAGSDLGIGQYITTLRVGTPSQMFRVIVDTGSDLTSVRCRYRCSKRSGDCTKKGRINRKRVFHAPLSSSFSPVPCSSERCKVELMTLFSLSICPTPLTPCAYDYGYADGSATRGVFADETVTVGLTNGRKTRLRNVLIGCSDSYQGTIFDNVDGLLGLGNTEHSFATYAAEKFGGKFSYCLVDHLSNISAASYVTFGMNRNQVKLSGNARHTTLELHSLVPFYGVNVRGISIDDKMLEIPMKVWDVTQGGGMILDSGSSLTYLTDPAYQTVMEVLTMSVSKYPRVKLDTVPMDYCFNSTGFSDISVPKFIIHFKDGARFEPHWDSYVITAGGGVKCLGFLPARVPGVSVIGNIMQQNYFWEYDLIGKKLNFAPSACS
ncbi:NAC domain-containing protein 29-like [Hibiscus syriacus]|uniref:NAC domain-containing protein 29-like n=1 Tax=Hibiscus syriacus TaxID=106335 RepID=A0A6A3CW04_HIBSY|nr:aspartic proteinase NANA, chloroplast-like [Hibiscus syriacus]KAE8733503.1 NAC domain-containing protein 29-like [Hibiscus syriacus]